jgi:hypothetical protein
MFEGETTERHVRYIMLRLLRQVLPAGLGAQWSVVPTA